MVTPGGAGWGGCGQGGAPGWCGFGRFWVELGGYGCGTGEVVVTWVGPGVVVAGVVRAGWVVDLGGTGWCWVWSDGCGKGVVSGCYPRKMGESNPQGVLI